MWPKVVKSGMVRFRTSRSFRLSFFRSSISISGQTSRGGGGNHPTPQVRSRMAKYEVQARVNLSRIQASTDMQLHLLGLSSDFDLSSNVGVDLPGYRSTTVSKTWS